MYMDLHVIRKGLGKFWVEKHIEAY